jgi:sensor histidine kinase YesM
MYTQTANSRVKKCQLSHLNSFDHSINTAKLHRSPNNLRSKPNKLYNILLIGGVVLSFSSLALLLLSKQKRNLEAYKRNIQIQSKTASTNLKALRMQMNPHFIFNALNSINYFIDRNEKQQASDYVAKFASLMRKILINSEKSQVLLGEDLELLRTYLEIELIRLEGKFSYSINIDPDVNKNNTLVPPGILQPFVENSIWHGITQMKEKGQIIIDIKKEEQMLVCLLSDNGVGRSGAISKNKGYGSRGIDITKNRIEILNETKNCNARVKIIDKPQGVRVQIKLPFEKAF